MTKRRHSFLALLVRKVHGNLNIFICQPAKFSLRSGYFEDQLHWALSPDIIQMRSICWCEWPFGRLAPQHHP